MANLFEVKPIAARLLSEFSLVQSGWQISYDLQHTRTFGNCNSNKRLIRMNPLLCATNSLDRVIETVKHEIAHAVVGSWNMHNETWKAQMIRMGLEPKQCFQWGENDVLKPATLWTAACLCGRTYNIPRMSSRGYRCSNPTCRLALTFTQNTARKVQLKAAALGISYIEDLGF